MSIQPRVYPSATTVEDKPFDSIDCIIASTEKPSRSTSESRARTNVPMINPSSVKRSPPKASRSTSKARERTTCARALHIYTFILLRSLSTVRFRLIFAHVSVRFRMARVAFSSARGSPAMAGDSPNERGCAPNNVVAGTRPDPGPNRPPWYPAARDWAQDEQCPRCNHVFLFHQDAIGCCNNPSCFSFRIPISGRSLKVICGS
jgi:hypothetical protein